MDFGLGLILSFTDNATAGINNAVNSLNQLTQTAENATNSMSQMASLSALSVVSGTIGDSFTTMGSTIISTLSQVVSKVNSTGQTLMFAENQLNKLYEGSGKTGAQVVGQIQDYAKSSIFEFENLITAVTALKSVGIEAFDDIVSSSGKAYQLMDMASDLAAFNPTMRNVYGTGVNAAIGALREYIAEGNAMSLKRGAGLDITSILGEDKGTSIEERSRQVADLLEQLNMVGMTAQLANSPMTKLSNMQDTLFQFIGQVADSGVYEKFSELISVFADFVMGIDDDKLANLAQVVGSALTAMLEPVKTLAQGIVRLASAFFDLIQNNPAIAKFAVLGSAIAGVLLLLVGVVLKITSALAGFSLMLLTSGKSFKDIGNLFTVGGKKIIGVMTPLALAVTALYIAWKRDFFGIQKIVSDFMLILQALADGWNDFTISEDLKHKLDEAGLTSIVEDLYDIKYRLDALFDGFKTGFKSFMQVFVDSFNSISTSLQGTSLEPIINSITSAIKSLSESDVEAWRKLGETIGVLVGSVLTLTVATKTIKGVVGAVTSLSRGFGEIKAIISGGTLVVATTKISSIFMKLATTFNVVKATATAFVTGLISKFTTFLNFLFGIPAKIATVLKSAFGAVSLVITGVTTAVSSFVSMFVNGFSVMKEVVMVLGVALTAIGAILLGVPATVAGIVASIVAIVATAVVVIKDNWNSISTSFAGGVASLKNAFSNAFNMITNGFNNMAKSASNVVSKIKGFFSNLKVKIPLPHFNITGSFSLKPPSVPKLSVDWYAKGGVFNQPSIIGVGEAGTEAVMPLENNTGWIGKLANMIVTEIGSIVPTNTHSVNTSSQKTGQKYFSTSNNSTVQNIKGDTDNSVVFNTGAIQLNVQNATDEEAMRMARKIMEYIKRQQELNLMLQYN